MRDIERAAHEVQIATYREAMRDLLDVTARLAAECGYTADDMQRIPAVARAKEMAK
jgi:hypothetical protein